MKNKTLMPGAMEIGEMALVIEAGATSLREAAHRVWPAAVTDDAELALSASTVPVLLLTTDIDAAWALDLDEQLSHSGTPSVLAVARRGAIWLHARRHPRYAPCLACLQAQADMLPWYSQPAPDDEEAAALLQLLLRALDSTAFQQLDDWTLLQSTPAGVHASSQLLKDPICAVCSEVALRPNQVYFHEEVSHV